ncbi:MAG: RNA methyltransferase [Chlorobi bacterium]|nr:RNA methyltransferase [Chlorobiota bacterium]
MELPSLSKANARWIVSLHHKRHRDSERCFIAEGIRTVEELARSRYRVRMLVCTAAAASEHGALVRAFAQRRIPVYVATESVFERLADTKTPQGVLAIVEYPDECSPAGNIVALDGIADPGNAGTIVRTALWFGYRCVVFGRGAVDRYQPKFVRATMGALFHLDAIEQPLDEFLARVGSTHRIIGATTSGGEPLATFRPPNRAHVLVIGSEAHGVSAGVEALLTDRVTIEGTRSFDSLNAAVAAGIVMYHLFRTQ